MVRPKNKRSTKETNKGGGKGKKLPEIESADTAPDEGTSRGRKSNDSRSRSPTPDITGTERKRSTREEENDSDSPPQSQETLDKRHKLSLHHG